MNITAIRQRPQWLVLSVVVLAAAIGGTLRIMVGQTPIETPSAPTTAERSPHPPAGQETPDNLFETPMMSLSAELRKAATPDELLRSTMSEDRLSVITAGRPDPFAPIMRPIGPLPSSTSDEAEVTSSPPSIPVAPSLPEASISRIPDLPALPTVNAAPPSLPSIPLASGPLPIPSLPSNVFPGASAPQSPIQAVEVTGVIQVGNRVGVIVREGNGQSSRHLFEGDLLANGQIRVKAINLAAEQPVVILEYQGKEYPRTIS